MRNKANWAPRTETVAGRRDRKPCCRRSELCETKPIVRQRHDGQVLFGKRVMTHLAQKRFRQNKANFPECPEMVADRRSRKGALRSRSCETKPISAPVCRSGDRRSQGDGNAKQSQFPLKTLKGKELWLAGSGQLAVLGSPVGKLKVSRTSSGGGSPCTAGERHAQLGSCREALSAHKGKGHGICVQGAKTGWAAQEGIRL